MSTKKGYIDTPQSYEKIDPTTSAAATAPPPPPQQQPTIENIVVAWQSTNGRTIIRADGTVS